MYKKEARLILAEHLDCYRSRPYEELAAWTREGRIETPEALARSGKEYQLEIRFFWDNKPNGNVRVFGSIDDGGIRAFLPLTDCFIVSPEGKFIGE